LVPAARKPAILPKAYAAFVDQFRNLGATYVRLERRRRGPAVEYLACCEAAGDARLEAQGDSPEAALDQLLAELRARDVSEPHP
jgi:hypothetical protein